VEYDKESKEEGAHMKQVIRTIGHLQHKLWQKKGRESNWQFDFRPLKVGNQPDPDACRWSATHHWKVLDENYKFASNFIPIGGLGKKL
jgi:hypothetical protein